MGLYLVAKPMRIALFFMHFIVVAFFIGIAGSAVVVGISFFEDLLILMGIEKGAKAESK